MKEIGSVSRRKSTRGIAVIHADIPSSSSDAGALPLVAYPSDTAILRALRRVRASSQFFWGFLAGVACVSVLVALAALLMILSFGR